ncbi:hypothetical protein EK904_012788 [Melospiza melodia maxima]|nr:hypothetical protein EK904_012788 [Melospiza melodia maxima]
MDKTPAGKLRLGKGGKKGFTEPTKQKWEQSAGYDTESLQLPLPINTQMGRLYGSTDFAVEVFHHDPAKTGPIVCQNLYHQTSKRNHSKYLSAGSATSCILPVAGGGGEGAANFPWYGLSSRLASFNFPLETSEVSLILSSQYCAIDYSAH